MMVMMMMVMMVMVMVLMMMMMKMMMMRRRRRRERGRVRERRVGSVPQREWGHRQGKRGGREKKSACPLQPLAGRGQARLV